MKDFNGKKVAITGASSGIGAEFAKQLSSKGASMILIARREERLKKLCAECGNNSSYMIADLSVEAEIHRIGKILAEEKIDILINNAGIGSFGYFDELSSQAEIQLVTLNSIAPLALTHAVIPHMKSKNDCGIIFISSIAAFQPLPLMNTYAATKSFNYMQGRALAVELKAFKIKVLTVCPGPVATEFGGVARVPGTWTGGKRNSVSDVVSESIRAYQRGSQLVVPTLRAKCMALGSIILPKRLSSLIVYKALKRTYDLSKSSSAQLFD